MRVNCHVPVFGKLCPHSTLPYGVILGLGCSMVAMSWMIGMNYVVIITYAIYLFFASVTSDLPFSDCTHEWNTYTCIKALDLKDLNSNATELQEYLEGEYNIYRVKI